MIELKIRVELPQGLSARPAAHFVKVAASFTSEIKLGKNSKFIDGKSILGVMSMAFGKGEEVALHIEGPDEEIAMEALQRLLQAAD